MSEAEKEKLVALADILMSTLEDMPAEQADKVVTNCIEAIYNDLLDTPGKVQKSGFRLCTIYGTSAMVSHKFVPES